MAAAGNNSVQSRRLSLFRTCFLPYRVAFGELSCRGSIGDLIRYDPEVLLGGPPPVKSVYYKNAKIALVGDSGVGKSGLALAITGKQFVPTESTHGRKIAVIKRQRVRMPEDKREVRELILLESGPTWVSFDTPVAP